MDKGGWKDALIARAWAAHQNSWEAFIGFSAAVVMAVVSKKEVPDFLLQCNAFLWIRALYILMYTFAFNAPLSVLRSASFIPGFAIVLNIMFSVAGW